MVKLYKVVFVFKKKKKVPKYILITLIMCLNIEEIRDNDEYNEYDSLKEKSKNRNISKLHPLHCEGTLLLLLTVFDC